MRLLLVCASVLGAALAGWLLARALRGCPHRATYFERREHQGVPGVAHHVCWYCGLAWPVLQRTSEEHLQARLTGEIRPFVVTRSPRPRTEAGPADVTPIEQAVSRRMR